MKLAYGYLSRSNIDSFFSLCLDEILFIFWFSDRKIDSSFFDQRPATKGKISWIILFFQVFSEFLPALSESMFSFCSFWIIFRLLKTICVSISQRFGIQVHNFNVNFDFFFFQLFNYNFKFLISYCQTFSNFSFRFVLDIEYEKRLFSLVIEMHFFALKFNGLKT